MRYSSPNGLYSQASVTDGSDDQGNDFLKEDFGIARLTSVVSSSIVNDGLVQYGRDFEYTYANRPAPNDVPLSHNAFGRAPSTQIAYNFGSGIYTGANSNLDRIADPDERRLQLLDSVTWTKGKHVAKVGLEFNKVSDYVNNLYNGNGSYSYDYGYTYIADYLSATTGLGKSFGYPQLYYSYSQTFGNPVGLITTREYAGYATDDWRILPNLTLTVGVALRIRVRSAKSVCKHRKPAAGGGGRGHSAGADGDACEHRTAADREPAGRPQQHRSAHWLCVAAFCRRTHRAARRLRHLLRAHY